MVKLDIQAVPAQRPRGLRGERPLFFVRQHHQHLRRGFARGIELALLPQPVEQARKPDRNSDAGQGFIDVRPGEIVIAAAAADRTETHRLAAAAGSLKANTTSAKDFDKAMRIAEAEDMDRAATYLLRIPMVADYLEEALLKLGYSVRGRRVPELHNI